MRRLIIIFALLLICSILKAQRPFSTDFESQPKGTPYSLNIWKSDGFVTDPWDNGMKERSMVDDSFAVSGNKSLRITYTKGGVGPMETGAQVPIVLPGRDQYYLSYRLRFSDNFSFQLGGKLPGLAAGGLCSGGEGCNGTNGFTARFMWVKGGKIILYLYHMDKNDKWGDGGNLIYPSGDAVQFKRGKWYQITQRVKINSLADSHDGEVEVWVDGLPVLLRKGIRFTSNGEKVDRFYFSTFHGGNTSDWSPDQTCYIWFDDIKISENRKDFEIPQEH